MFLSVVSSGSEHTVLGRNGCRQVWSCSKRTRHFSLRPAIFCCDICLGDSSVVGLVPLSNTGLMFRQAKEIIKESNHAMLQCCRRRSGYSLLPCVPATCSGIFAPYVLLPSSGCGQVPLGSARQADSAFSNRPRGTRRTTAAGATHPQTHARDYRGWRRTQRTTRRR